MKPNKSLRKLRLIPAFSRNSSVTFSCLFCSYTVLKEAPPATHCLYAEGKSDLNIFVKKNNHPHAHTFQLKRACVGAAKQLCYSIPLE